MTAAENADAPVLTFTMQVTASRALLIADWMETGGGRQTYIVEVSRPSLFVARETSPAPQLQRELLWQQEKPIQSALEWQDPATEERYLFLLSDGFFVRCRFENGAWKVLDSAELPVGGRRSRGADESIVYNPAKDKVELVLGKKTCELNAGVRVAFSCSGSALSEKSAELSSTCEASPGYLASGKGDYTQLDRISLKPGGANGTAPEVSYASSVEMPGPVLDIGAAENKKAAAAVVKNLSTGNYEVYRIMAVCGN